MITPDQLTETLNQAAVELEEAQAELDRRVREWAEADHAYAVVKATAYLRSEGTVGERESQVALECGDERYRAHLAEGLRQSALEAVRNRRQQLSAWQTRAALMKSEMDLAKYGPEAA